MRGPVQAHTKIIFQSVDINTIPTRSCRGTDKNIEALDVFGMITSQPCLYITFKQLSGMGTWNNFLEAYVLGR